MMTERREVGDCQGLSLGKRESLTRASTVFSVFEFKQNLRCKVQILNCLFVEKSEYECTHKAMIANQVAV